MNENKATTLNRTIDEYNSEIVDNFIYLSMQLTEDVNDVDKIKRGIQLANRPLFSVLLILKVSCIYRENNVLIMLRI